MLLRSVVVYQIVKTWSAAMSVGRSVFVYIHVLHKINNADKLTDNRFKFNKNFCIILSQLWTLFISSFITICDYLDRCRFHALQGKGQWSVSIRVSLYSFPDTRSHIWPKKGENTSLNFQCVVLTNPFFFYYLFIF